MDYLLYFQTVDNEEVHVFRSQIVGFKIYPNTGKAMVVTTAPHFSPMVKLAQLREMDLGFADVAMSWPPAVVVEEAPENVTPIRA